MDDRADRAARLRWAGGGGGLEGEDKAGFRHSEGFPIFLNMVTDFSFFITKLIYAL